MESYLGSPFVLFNHGFFDDKLAEGLSPPRHPVLLPGRDERKKSNNTVKDLRVNSRERVIISGEILLLHLSLSLPLSPSRCLAEYSFFGLSEKVGYRECRRINGINNGPVCTRLSRCTRCTARCSCIAVALSTSRAPPFIRRHRKSRLRKGRSSLERGL